MASSTTSKYNQADSDISMKTRKSNSNLSNSSNQKDNVTTNERDSEFFDASANSSMSNATGLSSQIIHAIEKLLDEKLKVFNNLIVELRESNEILANRINAVETKCVELAAELASAKNCVAIVESKTEGIVAELVNKCNNYEQQNKSLLKKLHAIDSYTRRDSLMFCGLPYNSYAAATSATEASSQQHDENRENDAATEAAVVAFCRDMLCLDITPNDVSIAHRVPVKSSLQHQRGNRAVAPIPVPVIVKFTSRKARDLVYNSRLQLKRSGCRVYINEHLTQETQKLFYEVRQKIHSKGIHSCWTKNGTIFYKKTKNSEPRQVWNISELEC